MSDSTISRFDKGSGQYQADSIKFRKLSADKVSKLVHPAPMDVILDIGCGTGTQLLELSQMIKRGIGIDISTGMVELVGLFDDAMFTVTLEKLHPLVGVIAAIRR